MRRERKRTQWVDVVRILSTFLVVFYHGNRFYDYQVSDMNLLRSFIADRFTRFMSQWLMPIFWFISGYSFSMSLEQTCHYEPNQSVIVTDSTQYYKIIIYTKFKRLIIPGIVTNIIFVAAERFVSLFYHQHFTSIWEYPRYLFEYVLYGRHFSLSHVWFVLVLFFYCILNVPFFVWLREHSIVGNNNNNNNLSANLRNFKDWKFLYIVFGIFFCYLLFLYLSLPYSYIQGLLGQYIIVLAWHLCSVSSNFSNKVKRHLLSVIFVSCAILNEILMFYLTDPLPSINGHPEQPNSAIFALISFHSFFIIGFCLHYFPSSYLTSLSEKESLITIEEDQKIMDYHRLFQMILLCFSVLFSAGDVREYVHHDRSQASLSERILFELGAWLWLYIICQMSQQIQTSMESLFYNSNRFYYFLRDSSFVLYLTHTFTTYLLAYFVKMSGLTKGNLQVLIGYFIVIGGSIVMGWGFHFIFNSNFFTRFLFGYSSSSKKNQEHLEDSKIHQNYNNNNNNNNGSSDITSGNASV